MNWYNSLTTPEKIYFYIAVIGTVLLVIQIIMMICSFGGGADADALGAEVAEMFSDLDVEVQYGGQPLYYYLISAE